MATEVYVIIKEPASVMLKNDKGQEYHACPIHKKVGQKIRLNAVAAKDMIKWGIVRPLKAQKQTKPKEE